MTVNYMHVGARDLGILEYRDGIGEPMTVNYIGARDLGILV